MKIIILLCFMLTSCAYLGGGSVNNVAEISSACEIDVSQRIEIERVSFNLSEIWDGFTSCKALMIQKNMDRGDFHINAMGVFGYKDVVGTSSALGFHISGNLNHLGMYPKWYNSPEEWMQWKEEKWERRAKSKNARPKERKINRVNRHGMDCWRIETKSYLNKAGSIDEYEQSNLGVYYQCWSEDSDRYPPIDLGAGVTYRNGKSLYPDLDMDKDLLDPVFKSLVLKELPKQRYADIVDTNTEKKRKSCEENYERYKDRIKKRRLTNNSRVKDLIECGYRADEIVSLRCDTLKSDMEAVKHNFIAMSRKLYFEKKHHEESMLSCGFSQAEVESYHREACQLTYQRALEQKKKKWHVSKNHYMMDYLQECGYSTQVFH